jgi:hypothetical protein
MHVYMYTHQTSARLTCASLSHELRYLRVLVPSVYNLHRSLLTSAEVTILQYSVLVQLNGSLWLCSSRIDCTAFVPSMAITQKSDVRNACRAKYSSDVCQCCVQYLC